MKFIIIGRQGAGKSTFGAFLAEELGTKATDTSQWLVDVEKARQKALMERYGITPWMARGMPPKPNNPDGTLDLTEEFDMSYGWDDVRNRPARELLVALGDAVNSVGNTFLVDRCFDKGDIAVGVRRRNELVEIRKAYHNVVVVFIDRDAGGEQAKDNFELTAEDANVIVRAKTIAGAKQCAAFVANLTRGIGRPLYESSGVIVTDELHAP